MMSGPPSGRSPGRSRKGSHYAGSYVGAASQAGSQAGSRAGSQAGSRAGSQSTVSSAACPRYVLLRHSLAISLRRTGSVPGPAPRHDDVLDGDLDAGLDNDFWMYDNGYLLFQGFVEANARCFWSAALLEAMRELSFEGYVSPGVLLVRAGACALDVVRAAWGRRVLKPPPNYVIADVGDIEDCLVVAVPQSQFTPLPEALCWVILELTSTGQTAVLPSILRALPRAFPAMTLPEAEVVYDALAKLSSDRKVYQTARGYFLVTPETRRRLASMQPPSAAASASQQRRGRRSMLLSNEEALVMVHGDMQTERDGPRTHQCVQTNLADVICGGNPEDKVLYARDRGAEDRALERRHSLRLSTRLGQALQRAGSLRSLPPRPPPAPPSSTPPSPEKKQSLLSRLFRRSGRPRGPRGRRGQSAPPGHSSASSARSPSPQIRTFSAQFPHNDDEDADRHPADWFNPAVTSRTSVATQTQAPASASSAHSSPAASRWASPAVPRASTLPRSLSRGSPRRARRLSDSLGLSVSRAASPASHHGGSHHGGGHHGGGRGGGGLAPTAASLPPASPSLCPSPSPSPSLCPSLSPSKCAGKLQAARKTSPSNTLLSCASSRASRASAVSRASASTSGMSKASSGYNSSGTRSGSPTTSATTVTTAAGTRRSLPTPTKSSFTSLGLPSGRNSTTTTATINGANTKIYVQQHNAPVRSVITIENRSSGEHTVVTRRGGVLETSFDRAVPKSSSSAAGGPAMEVVTTVVPAPVATSDPEYSHNKINNHNLSGKLHPVASSSSSTASSEESLTSAGSLVTKEAKEAAEMNNIRKLSLTAPAPGFLRESLSYKNILKEVQNYGGGQGQQQQAQTASPYASLSDLSVHCKSLAAQRILSGVSINSIDTLVEVNMAASMASSMAAEKKTNCDVTIRTDFGMV